MDPHARHSLVSLFILTLALLACSLVPSGPLAPQATPAPTAAGAGQAGVDRATKTPSLLTKTPAPTSTPVPGFPGFTTVQVLANNVLIEPGVKPENILQSLDAGGLGGGEVTPTPLPALEFLPPDRIKLISLPKDTTVEINLSKPDGGSYTETVSTSEEAICLNMQELTQEGEYQISANAGALSLSESFSIQYDKPQVFIGRSAYFFVDLFKGSLCGGRVVANEPTYFFYAGFAPHQKVQVLLYLESVGGLGSSFGLLSSWIVEVDNNGRLIQYIETPSMKTDMYLLRVYAPETLATPTSVSYALDDDRYLAQDVFLTEGGTSESLALAYQTATVAAYSAEIATANAQATLVTYTPSPTPRFPHFVSLAHIPAGEFKMGSAPGTDPYAEPIEMPQHSVYISDFWIEYLEVSNKRYRACVEAGVCTPPQRTSSKTRAQYYDLTYYDDYPVIYVTYAQAQAYCKWGGGRLPTEAEWEKAARFYSDGGLYPWGDETDKRTLSFINHDNQVGDTEDIFGGVSNLGNIAGNVWEWTSDWFSRTYYAESPEKDPAGPETGTERVVRGGGFSSALRFLRNANRYSRLPDQGYDSIGFRCVTTSAP